MRDTDDDVRRRAASWFARLRAPGGEADRTAFEAWRTSDPRHDAAYTALEEDWRRSNVLRESALLDSFRLPSPWWRRLAINRVRILAPAVATLLLVVATALWFAVHPARPQMPPNFASRVGEIRTVTLGDGTRVTLDTASAITELQTEGERRVRLDRGRARFDVVHDPRRPFIVVAGAATIVDKGTVFDVRIEPHRVEVVLLHGKVEVAATRAIARPAALLQIEGQRAIVAADQPPVLSPTRAQERSTWVSGMLEFSDTPLGEVFAEINRYNPRSIILDDPRLADLRVTGAFRANAPADVARNLAALFELRLRSDAQGNWILSANK